MQITMQDVWINFRSPVPEKLHMKSDWLAQWFQRRCLKSVDDRRRTTKAYLSYKLTKWAFGSDELINKWAKR